MIDITQLTTIGLFSFGGVWVISFIAQKYFNRELESQTKLILSAVIAFAVGYVPVELSNELANRIKDAIAISVAFTGLYQGGKKIVNGQ